MHKSTDKRCSDMMCMLFKVAPCSEEQTDELDEFGYLVTCTCHISEDAQLLILITKPVFTNLTLLGITI